MKLAKLDLKKNENLIPELLANMNSSQNKNCSYCQKDKILVSAINEATSSCVRKVP